MARSITTRELRQAQRLSVALTLLVLCLGAAGLAWYFLGGGSQGKPITTEVAYLLASAFISAALVSLLLNRATLEESRLSLRRTIEGTIESSLLPLRELVQADCQVDYRWHCLLSMPGPEDDHLDYAYQQMTIEKDIADLPGELRFVCIASMADDALAPYADDSRYHFRWLIDEGLDPYDEKLFAVRRVSLNGRELKGKDASSKARVPHRRILCYPVPRGARDGQRHTVSFDVLVRKHVGNERRIRIRTQLFTTTFGADFRCTIAENVPVTSVWVSTSEVTSFGPMQPVSGEGTLVAGLPCSLHVRYTAPLQSGSTVAFHLDRAPTNGAP
jgi:hypothetical protein